jgi:predicted O-methyltransferase YrrM
MSAMVNTFVLLIAFRANEYSVSFLSYLFTMFYKWLNKKGLEKTLLLFLITLIVGELILSMFGIIAFEYFLAFNQFLILGVVVVVYKRQVKNFNRLDSAYLQVEYRDWIHNRFSWNHPVILNSRGWSASPDFLYELVQSLEVHKCSNILEVSSGLSTLVCAKWVQNQNVESSVTSIESSKYHLEKTAKSIDNEGLSQFSQLIHAPISEKSGVLWHDSEVLDRQLDGPYDCLIVDGPPATENKLARFPALDVLMPHLADSCLIILDDYIRQGEREIVKRWLKTYPLSVVSSPQTEKGMIVLILNK